MRLRSFQKILVLLIFSVSYFSLLTPAVVAQQASSSSQSIPSEPILIPLEKLKFEPAREQFPQPGETDLVVTAGDIEGVNEGAKCRFTFNQIAPSTDPSRSAEIYDNFVESTYNNRSCVGKLLKDQQKSKDYRIGVEITNRDQTKFSSYITYFTDQSVTIVDPNTFTLPINLYIKPNIDIILSKAETLQVGDQIEAQVQITNRDNFALKEFSVTTSIPDRVGKIDCNSFNFTENTLKGRMIYQPGLRVFAQENNDGDVATCKNDQYTFEINLVNLEARKTTKLNFNLSVENPGDLKFNILTNLDQGKISKETSPVLVIQPSLPTNRLPTWSYYAIGATVLAILIGGYIWWKRRGKK